MVLSSCVLVFLSYQCTGETIETDATIPIISWAGIPAELSAELFPMLKECGIDWHLGLYGSSTEAMTALDAAEVAGIGLIPGFPAIKDSTAWAVSLMKDSPALVAWHLKDEPELSDIEWLSDLATEIHKLDSIHPPYVNLYPDWAWGEDRYKDNIETFAANVDVPFYSFDQYPVTEKDGTVLIRPTWYRNLEVFSRMARRYGKPFWAFALTESHRLGPPSPPAFYPVPTEGHLRLQVFSDLLYGAQAIQYYTFRGMYNPETLEKTPVYEVVKTVNSEIKAYSPVFCGCKVEGVWHMGDTIPQATVPLVSMPHPSVKSIEIEDGVISLISNRGKQYLAVQNRNCTSDTSLNISFNKDVSIFTGSGIVGYGGELLKLSPGNIIVFILGDKV